MSTYRYESIPETLSLQAVRLLYIASSKYEGDWHSIPHAHQCMELFYVVSGSGAFQVEDATFAVSAGDIVIINPQVSHTERCTQADPMAYIVIGIEGADFLIEGEDSPRYCTFRCGARQDDILHDIQAILVEIKAETPYSAAIAARMLDVVLMKLMRYQALSMHAAAAQPVSQTCARLKHYLDHQYAQPITLDSLAGLMHVSKYYLSHAFSAAYGISPMRYLVARRIQESRSLLAHTDSSIATISQILGFSSPSYFAQAFQRLQGMSPSAYRKAACR